MWTNLGKQRMFETWFEADAAPSFFCIQAAEAGATTWDADLSSTSQVTIVSGTGGGMPASGLQVARDGTDLVVSVSLASDYARATLADGFEFSAVGETISGIDYILLTDDNADPAAKEIYAFWPTGAEVNIAEGNSVSVRTMIFQGN